MRSFILIFSVHSKIDTKVNTDHNGSNMKRGENVCELIYLALRVFLLRRHNIANADHGVKSKLNQKPYFILQPIIDLLQYRVFCERIQVEFDKVTRALNFAGIPSTLSFTAVGESGSHIVSLLCDTGNKDIGGEAVIRIDDWYASPLVAPFERSSSAFRNTLWFTFISPSTLTAHLPQATLEIASIPQLSQLLMDELERCLLQRICALGEKLCDVVGGVWFIDLNRCVARWDGSVL